MDNREAKMTGVSEEDPSRSSAHPPAPITSARTHHLCPHPGRILAFRATPPRGPQDGPKIAQDVLVQPPRGGPPPPSYLSSVPRLSYLIVTPSCLLHPRLTTSRASSGPSDFLHLDPHRTRSCLMSYLTVSQHITSPPPYLFLISHRPPLRKETADDPDAAPLGPPRALLFGALLGGGRVVKQMA